MSLIAPWQWAAFPWHMQPWSALGFRIASEGDAVLVEALLHRLSADTWHRRFMTSALPTEYSIATEMARMAQRDALQHIVVLALVSANMGEEALGIAELVCDPAGMAELAIVVRDDRQRQGIGRALLRRSLKVARARGVRRLVVDTLSDNLAMLALIREIDAPQTTQRSRGEVRIVVDLAGTYTDRTRTTTEDST